MVQVQLPRDRRSCCTNSTSVSIPHSEGMKYRQTGPTYQTPAWKKTYGTYRNVIETRNDLLKNGRGLPLVITLVVWCAASLPRGCSPRWGSLA